MIKIRSKKETEIWFVRGLVNKIDKLLIKKNNCLKLHSSGRYTNYESFYENITHFY